MLVRDLIKVLEGFSDTSRVFIASTSDECLDFTTYIELTDQAEKIIVLVPGDFGGNKLFMSARSIDMIREKEIAE